MVMLLFARDVAARRGLSLSAARAWLASLERTHGAAVVGRVGNRLCTTEEALASVLPGAGREASRRVPALEMRVTRLVARVRELQLGIAHLEARLRVLEAERENRRAPKSFRFRALAAPSRLDPPDSACPNRP